MKLEEMIMISVDDHAIEPREMFVNHFPASRLGEAPRVVTTDDGQDRWIFQGLELGAAGLNAVASWPKEEWNNDPVGYAEMRPGCYDVHDRVRDMDANGQLAGLCFPTFPGFAGTHLMNAPDKGLSNLVVSAYNDWHVEDWAGAHPGRFLPLGILPVWDVAASVAEVHRLNALGVRAVTFPEVPYVLGLPSFSTDHWDPVLAALNDVGMVLCFHIGGAFRLLQRPPEYSMDQHIILSPQLSAVAWTDVMVSGMLTRFPNLRIAMSEGGIGWIPFLLDRVDLHVSNQTWLGLDLGGMSGTEYFRKHFLGCFITNPSSLFLRERIGIEAIAWECDYPHSDSTWPKSPEVFLDECLKAGMDDKEIDMVSWQNACRFFGYEPFSTIERSQATVGSLRSRAKDVDTGPTSRNEFRRRFADAH